MAVFTICSDSEAQENQVSHCFHCFPSICHEVMGRDFPLGFPCGSADKESACNAGDLGSFPGLGRSPREGKGYPLQYCGLENSMCHKESNTTGQLSLWYVFLMGLDAMILVFWMLSFKPSLLLSSFTFIKRLFSSSSFSAIRVVSFAYLRF